MIKDVKIILIKINVKIKYVTYLFQYVGAKLKSDRV